MAQPEPPAQKSYRFKARYFIVGEFGDLLWNGTIAFNQNAPWPTDEKQAAFMDWQVARLVRETAPPEAPQGKVLIACVIPV